MNDLCLVLLVLLVLLLILNLPFCKLIKRSIITGTDSNAKINSFFFILSKSIRYYIFSTKNFVNACIIIFFFSIFIR